MRRFVVMTASALVAVAALAALAMEPAAAQEAPQMMALAVPAAVTGVTSAGRNGGYTCHKAWRCGPYECGWRQICSWAGRRSYWRSHRYSWRSHEWRRHYW
jgi:hypothetical protein